MKLSKYFSYLIILGPLLEIVVFIIVGSYIGVLPTIMLIILTTMIGMIILRSSGWVQLHEIQKQIKSGANPALAALQTAMIMFAGFLLFLPGFITDIMGLLLLIPAMRRLLLKWLIGKQIIQTSEADRVSVIEGEFWRDDEK